MNISSAPALARRVLRAVHSLGVAGSQPSVAALVAVVPAHPTAVCAMIRVLHDEGMLDVARMRLTMRGFAAMHLPMAVAYERRRTSGVRKAMRVAS